ncbi:MAG: CBS domain-containing protein [Burkholderiaceae bacterium]
MVRVADVMTRGVRSLAPSDTLQLAAQAMEELDVGVIPVCEGGKVIGMVTDRDIVLRGVAQGLPAPTTALREVMSAQVETCLEDESIDDATQKMEEGKIRRLPVLDRQGRLVGILSLGDLATKADSYEAGVALSDISEPSAPDRSGTSAASGTAGGGSSSGMA